MRVLILSRYGDMGSSSRMRMFQYIPYLRAGGMRVTVQGLLDNAYLAELYERARRRPHRVALAYLKRLRAVWSAGEFDLVWLEKECWPWIPAIFDPGLLRVCRYVADYDDAVFHSYDQHPSALLRTLFGRKIDCVMRNATIVFAGNNYLGDRAKAAGASRIEIIPTVVNLSRFAQAPRRGGAGIVVGWIGSPSTQHLLMPLVPVLEKVLSRKDDQFVTIGANFAAPLLANHRQLRWSEDTEAQEISKFDIGVMPLADRPFERGKCGFKLIQYMACGLPVVASPVGVNREIVSHGVNGFLAETPQAWSEALGTLKSDPALRERLGACGRVVVETGYCTEVMGPRVVSLLREAAEQERRGRRRYW